MQSRHSDELYRQATKGDPVALNELFACFRSRLHSVGLRLSPRRLRAKIDSSDIVQSTLREAFQDFGKFHGASVSEFWLWLCTIHRNNARSLVTYYRAQHRNFNIEVPIDETVDFAHDPSIDRDLQQIEMAEITTRTLAELSEDDRQIPDLKVTKGLGYPEIYRLLRVTEETVRNRSSRAMICWLEQVETQVPPVDQPSWKRTRLDGASGAGPCESNRTMTPRSEN